MGKEALTTLELENKINKLKKRMIDSGLKKGLTHPETIKYSQELDQILNHFGKIGSIN